REVRNRPAQLREVARPPHVARAARVVERGDRAIVDGEKRRIAGRLSELRRHDHPQHADRVVRRGAPESIVEPPKHRTRFAMPAPPEVACEVVEPGDAFRKHVKVGISCHLSHAPTRDANLARSMLPPETTATTLPVPARPLSAAAIAHPAAPSAITRARSATSLMPRATSSRVTTSDPESVESSGHMVGSTDLPPAPSTI